MKKNILTIVIMAATLINVILSAVLVFSVMPAMNKTSNLVDKVASVIDLEIEDANAEEQEYTIDDLVAYTKTYDATVNINLKKEAGDDTNHYAQLSGFTLSFNTKAEDYSEISESIQGNDVYVDDIVKETISSYSASSIDLVKVRAEIVKKIQEKYNTKAVVEISLKDPLIA
ncbi:MAG: hypothetical protein MR304_06910 [Eubacterium sp.]|nr:hypothetical protein [Eubacterium sp.]